MEAPLVALVTLSLGLEVCICEAFDADERALVRRHAPETDDHSLTGDNICTHLAIRGSHKLLNVSYPCWRTYPHHCHHDETHPRIRWKRQDDDGALRPTRIPPGEVGGSFEPSGIHGGGLSHHTARCLMASRETCHKMVLTFVIEKEEVKTCCAGYKQIDGMCTRDIECGDDNGGCEQLCHVTDDDTHVCGCMPGYALIDRTLCHDLDECDGELNKCDQICNNVEGSYYCSCHQGYKLTGLHTCAEIDECRLGNGGCEHTCHNTPGAYYCECDAGYHRVDGFFCQDTNECDQNNGGCSDECLNEVGGHRCACPTSMTLTGDGKNCKESTELNGGVSFTPGRHQNDDNDSKISVSTILGGMVAGFILAGLVAVLIFRYKDSCKSKCQNALATPSPNSEARQTDISVISNAGTLFRDNNTSSATDGGNVYERPAISPVLPPSYETLIKDRYEPPPAYDNEDYTDMTSSAANYNEPVYINLSALYANEPQT